MSSAVSLPFAPRSLKGLPFARACAADDLAKSGDRPIVRVVRADWRHGDLRLRIRPLGWRFLLIALAIFKAKRPLTARPRAGRDGANWTRWITALETWLDGRGPLSFLPRHSKKFEPVPIVWSELPAAIGSALEGVCTALALPRVTGAEHYPSDGSASIAERLVALNHTYSRFRRGKVVADLLVSAANEVAAFVRAAPVPAPAPDGFENSYSAAELRELAALVTSRCASSWLHAEELEEGTWRELRYGRFNVADPIARRASLAYWRAEDAIRVQRRREVIRDNADAANPIRLGRAPTCGRGSDADEDGEKRHAAEDSCRLKGL